MVNVVSYNIHSGVGLDNEYDLERISTVLKRSEVDIACLQEVEVNQVARKVRKWSHIHSDDQPELLGEYSEMPNTVFLPCLNAYVDNDSPQNASRGEVLVNDKKKEVAYGIAILSKYEIIDSRSLLFSKQKETDASKEKSDFIYMDRDEQTRGAIAVLVQIPDELEPSGFKELWVINTHLCHKFCTAEQRSHAKQLLDWMRTFLNGTSTAILCGDMNSPASLPGTGAWVINAETSWRDLWKDTWKDRAKKPSSVTMPLLGYFNNIVPSIVQRNLGMRIDYIMGMDSEISFKKLICNQMNVLNHDEAAIASDHYPLWADIDIV